MSPKDEIALLIIGAVIGAVLGVTVTEMYVNGSWRDEAVARGHAEYSTTTGKWGWKEEQ